MTEPQEDPTTEAVEGMLAQMGITPEDVDSTWDKRQPYDPNSRVICSCGHAKNRHAIEDDFVTCNPSRTPCACGMFIPVLKVEDTRAFLATTKGPGPEHALVRGMRASLERNKLVEWIDGQPKCGKCGAFGYEKQLTITPLEGSPETGLRKSTQIEFARYNGFLCDDCWDLI